MPTRKSSRPANVADPTHQPFIKYSKPFKLKPTGNSITVDWQRYVDADSENMMVNFTISDSYGANERDISVELADLQAFADQVYWAMSVLLQRQWDKMPPITPA